MIVKGINAVLYFDDGGTDKFLACARSVTFTLVTEFIETSVSGTGTFATYLPTKNSFTGSVEGIVNLEPASMLSLSDLRALQVAQTLITCKFQRTDQGGNLYTDQASFYIASSSDTGSFDDMNTFSIELQGTGALAESES